MQRPIACEALRLYQLGHTARPHYRTYASSSLPRPYRFHVGASWAGKPPERRARRLQTKPFPPDHDIAKWRDGILSCYKGPVGNHIGEDFFFVEEMRSQSGTALGVADGVGGWVDSGVDPSLFSQALMFHAHRYSKSAWAGEPEVDPTQDYLEQQEVEGWEITPQECLENAFQGIIRERAVAAGSSTACLLTLNASSGLLRAANLGDSGFLIIRSANVIYQQKIQTHYFNCPKQLTKLPTRDRRYEGACVDSPKDASIYETKLRDGDIIVTYTDGLTDNVFNEEILWICSRVSHHHAVAESIKRGQGGYAQEAAPRDPDDALVQSIAESIIDYSRICMAHKTRQSPFEVAAAQEGMYFRGGKVDDVTVIITLVKETL